MVHFFFARIVYRIFRTRRARIAWFLVASLCMAAIAAGALATGIIYAELLNKTVIELTGRGMVGSVNVDLNMRTPPSRSRSR